MQSKKFLYILHYYFRREKNTTQGAKKLKDMYGDDGLQERQCWKLIDKFHSL